MLTRIAHLTDLTEASKMAFCHALRLAIAYKASFYILHICEPGQHKWGSFPHVREFLARWGYMGATEPPEEIEHRLGVRVAKVEVDSRDISKGLHRFLRNHPIDLLVMGTQGRAGLGRLLRRSKSEEVLQNIDIPCLIVRNDMTGFVDPKNGGLDLNQILMPVAHTPSPVRAVEVMQNLLLHLGLTPANVKFIHIGGRPPKLGSAFARNKIRLLGGKVEAQILEVAERLGSRLIVMPTAGHQNLSDTLWGSTTERVLHAAQCPVLAVPHR